MQDKLVKSVPSNESVKKNHCQECQDVRNKKELREMDSIDFIGVDFSACPLFHVFTLLA